MAAFFMWWPLVHKVEELPQMSGLLKLGYIMADGILLTPACALIMFSDTALYSTYSDPSAWAEAMKLCVPLDTLSGMTLTGPEMFSSMPVLEDQQLGAIVMKILQEIVYGTFLAIIFSAGRGRKEPKTKRTWKKNHILRLRFIKVKKGTASPRGCTLLCTPATLQALKPFL